MLQSLRLEPEHEQIVQLDGKIIREDRWWSLRWTVQREGYTPTDYVQGFSTPQEALPSIRRLLGEP